MNHTYCIKTVQTVQYCIKYGLLWGSVVAHKIALTPLNVCGVWMISQESIVLYWDTRFYEQHISYCGHRLHATALIWVFKSGLYERERATYSERLKPCSIWFQLRQHFQCDWMADFVFSLSLSLQLLRYSELGTIWASVAIFFFCCCCWLCFFLPFVSRISLWYNFVFEEKQCDTWVIYRRLECCCLSGGTAIM